MKQLSQLNKDQLGAIEFFKTHTAGILDGDVGTGKTASCLTALQDLLCDFAVHKVLVVAPRLVTERVWHIEITEWAHLVGLKVRRLVGTPAARLRALEADADIHVISRDNLRWLHDQFVAREGVTPAGKPIYRQFRKLPWDTLILDEIQSFKNQSSKRFKDIKRIRSLFTRLYGLTGSRMPNGYEDLWAQYFLVDGGARLGKSENAYHQRWFDTTVTEGIPSRKLRKGAAQEIDRLISDVTFVMKDCQPPVPRLFHKVQLSASERKLYNRMVHQSMIEVSGKEITAINAGVLWGKLLQMANGAVYDSDHQVHLIHNRKIEALLELLESLPRPVIIGYGFVHDVDRIRAKLASAGNDRVEVLRTNRSLDAWRRGEIDIGIMHPASAGHGLNDLYVSGAENLVWFGYTPNREFYDQLNGRLTGGHRRTGRSIVIHHIHAEGTIDDKALSMVDLKGTEQLAAQMRILGEQCKNETNLYRAPASRATSSPSRLTGTEANL